MRLAKYIKAAFVNHWNLLAVGGATVFAFLTGQPDVVLPIVLAAEVAYLSLLGTHPKFQKAVDAQIAKTQRVSGAVSAERALDRIRRALPWESLERYEALRARCIELRQIATDLRHVDPVGRDKPLERLQLSGLDRLLWIYLRLLYTEHSLRRFLEQTSADSIRADIGRLESRLADYPADETNARKQKARAALEDNLATSRARLANLEKAGENYELVQFEIDRLENKIRSLSELGVNRQEPDSIAAQVDSVASGMLQTERTMNELDFATGFGEIDESVPEMLNRPKLRGVS
ncbi:MAG: hypothetical protein GY715_06120 [Planctomycetes bacterium]|nr:hypothetical protein [Planctomycetota bacterium]